MFNIKTKVFDEYSMTALMATSRQGGNALSRLLLPV
jgi:hypothetical protein